MKILISKEEDSKEEIVESKSLERDRIALLHLVEVYKQFLSKLGNTTIDKDKELLNNIQLTYRLYFALKYRIELKGIIQSQINLCNIAVSIIERVKSGVTFNLACSKIPCIEGDNVTGILYLF